MNVKPIEILIPDDMKLRGQVWENGDDWVILLHDVGYDLDAWQPLMRPLLDRGYSVLSLDLRGHGASDGVWQSELAAGDVGRVLDFVGTFKPRKLFAVAAGIAGNALFAAQSEVQPSAVALLSPHPPQDEAEAEAMRAPGIAKLFLVGAHDENKRETALQIRNHAIGWSLVVNLPTTDNSMALLWGRWQGHAAEHILSFFHEQRHNAESVPQQRRPTMDQILGRGTEK